MFARFLCCDCTVFVEWLDSLFTVNVQRFKVIVQCCNAIVQCFWSRGMVFVE